MNKRLACMRWSKSKEFDGKLTPGTKYLRPSATIGRPSSQNPCVWVWVGFIARPLMSSGLLRFKDIQRNHCRFKFYKLNLVRQIYYIKHRNRYHHLSHYISSDITPDITRYHIDIINIINTRMKRNIYLIKDIFRIIIM